MSAIIGTAVGLGVVGAALAPVSRAAGLGNSGKKRRTTKRKSKKKTKRKSKSRRRR